MEKEEWRELIKGIYHQHISQKLQRIRRGFHPLEMFEEFPYFIRSLPKASRTIRYVDNNFDEDDDLSKAFKKEYLENTISDLHRGLELNQRYVLKSGIVDVIEEYFDEIAEGMEISDIPEQDFHALLEAGSQNPKSEVQLTMVRIKKRKGRIRFSSKESSIRYSLNESEQVIVRRKEELKKCSSNNPPRKKIFKGLGGICRGAILTGVNITLMAGWWPVPLSLDTITVGSVVSLTTGIGDIMIAIGELRGE